jgi:hypothetical protein
MIRMSIEVLRPADCRHITKLFREIPADVIAEGREWYPRARALAEELAKTRAYGERWLGWTAEVERAAAVIAVLSPRLNWERNKELARHAYSLASGEWIGLTVEQARASWVFGLTDGPSKAFRILVLNENPDDVVGGPKVRQFWHTIVDPTDPRGVVVDRHAIDVAFGRILSDAERGRALGKVGSYDHLSQLYRNATDRLNAEFGFNLTPAEIQAITWTYWRRTRAANAKANRKTEGK